MHCDNSNCDCNGTFGQFLVIGQKPCTRLITDRFNGQNLIYEEMTASKNILEIS